MTVDSTIATGLRTVRQREALLLAPYAMFSDQSRGRAHAEEEHPYRGPFQRDRDRVLHSSAFRRLSGKTQVFTGMGDYHRTRLTHTHEVASIARTLGRALGLNEDLIEALALFHDIGHPPFGHAGEDALNECLAGDGGFSHNRFALTIARDLEQRYPEFPGLNLTFEVLDSQAQRADKQADRPASLLEAQVVDLADSITYDAHDTDDAVKLQLVSLDALAEISIVRDAVNWVRDRHGPVEGRSLRKAVVHRLIDAQVSDVLAVAESRLLTESPRSAEAAGESGWSLVPTAELASRKAELEAFLYENVYRHPQLMKVRHEAQHRLKTMFDGLVGRPELLPVKFRERADEVGLRRAVADYLAAMTDRYCDEQFEAHFAS